MQRPDEAKRTAILKAAAELFARRPFHEVRLEDIAEQAHVGKGTLYIYFKGKDDLYGSLVLEGFNQLLDRVTRAAQAETGSAWETFELIVRELVNWAKRFPHVFALMRPGQERKPISGLRDKRRELAKLLESVIRRGIRDGELDDPRPDLTANFIPSCVRAALRFGPSDIGAEALSNHILRLVGGGILVKRRPA